ncbi:biotin carboxylase N-terminal domain-containing protein [Glutamicibacter mishrai]|uniref:Biotin-dependent 3-methylcrotonyl-coenzyme A carboxylase alpha1 subunit n=1 Tax=Glutamicibacter mishrai TaxID=1775880 RepID=A0A6H0SI15_9MICC|nr:biotin carboxylase N-terminal domain-containing protein [Glutamicibacter mishrai]QIV86954.1 biotin/lipoyl-binding protein [Glutamicibacter mishrai]
MNSRLFDTVLVANRGEIAVRIIRTLRTLGITSVAVYSDADAAALHVSLADTAVRLGGAPAAESYLDIEAVIKACKASGAQAVHPGYGFLSENVDFARALEDAGIVFIGPPVHSINLMGDKIRSKNHVQSHQVPVVPGIAEPELSDEQLLAASARVGFPLLIKPSAGGGGKGMFAVDSAQQLPEALASARRTALKAFGDDTLFLERLVRNPRHIEVQILADAHGNTVHLGERECSLQRRHQKVIEEAPAPLFENLEHGAQIRERMGAAAVAAAQSVGYVGAGTVEFLVSDQTPDEFFFMEMNTRLQVEHPVTEEVVRVRGQKLDLVDWQVRIAAGQPLDFTQGEVALHGHAVEARLYAEDPSANFLPSIGTILAVREPDGVRVDSSLRDGLEISAHYDPMLSKLIAWAQDRSAALARLDRALEQNVVLGVLTNGEYLRLLLADEDVAAGRLDTNLIERKMGEFSFRAVGPRELALAAHLEYQSLPASITPWGARDGWRAGQHRPITQHFDDGHQIVETTLLPTAEGSLITVAGEQFIVKTVDAGLEINEERSTAKHALAADGSWWFSDHGWSAAVRKLSRENVLEQKLASRASQSGVHSPDVLSPMPGTVISVQVSDGQQVVAGQLLAIVEAMKMEHQLLAPADGIVRLAALNPGDTVKAKQVIATVEPLDVEAEEQPA